MQNDFSLASIENKHLAATTNLPALDPFRGCDVLRYGQALIADRIFRIGFNGEV